MSGATEPVLVLRTSPIWLHGILSLEIEFAPEQDTFPPFNCLGCDDLSVKLITKSNLG